MKHWLVCDGGGTKLLALVVDEDLRILRCSRTGGVNPNFMPLAQIQGNMRACVDETLGDLDGEFVGVYGSMPGPLHILGDYARERYPHAFAQSIGEGRMGIMAGLCREHGFAALSGTGSDVFYEGPGGPLVVGGWGLLLGDEGSGGYIGQKAAIAAIHAHDGRGEMTSLLPSLLEVVGMETDGDRSDLMRRLCPYVYGAPSPRGVLASFAPLVAREAIRGDAVARGIYADAARQMAAQMDALVRKAVRVNPRALELPATVCGGAWKGTRLFFDAMRADLEAMHPELAFEWPLYEAIAGGAVEVGLSLGYGYEEIRARMAETFAEYRYPILKE